MKTAFKETLIQQIFKKMTHCRTENTTHPESVASRRCQYRPDWITATQSSTLLRSQQLQSFGECKFASYVLYAAAEIVSRSP